MEGLVELGAQLKALIVTCKQTPSKEKKTKTKTKKTGCYRGRNKVAMLTPDEVKGIIPSKHAENWTLGGPH